MPLNTAQKQQVTQFQSFTGTDKKTAEKQLRSYGWEIQRAVDNFYGGTTAPTTASASRTQTSTTTTSTLTKLFDRYRDDPTASPDTLLITGTQRYLSDLNIALDSPALLTLSTLVAATTLGNIPRDGFIAAWSHHGASTLKSQAALVARLTAEMATIPCAAAMPPSLLSAPGGSASASATASNESLFRRIYKTTFTLALPSTNTNARAVPLDEACEYWRLLLSPSSPGLKWVGAKHGTPWLEKWVGFLQTKWGKAVNRDLWGQTLLFAEKSVADEGLGFWSESSAWPGVVDEFVAFVKAERGREGWAGAGEEGEGKTKDGDGDEAMS